MHLFIEVSDVREAEALIAWLEKQHGEAGTRESARETRSAGRTEPADESWGDDNQASGDDPWADSAPSSSGAKSSGKNAGPWADVPRSGDQWKDTKQGKRHLEFGLDDAPDCSCGMPAVKVSGKGSKGIWSQWRCALSATEHYKQKCDYQEWATKK